MTKTMDTTKLERFSDSFQYARRADGSKFVKLKDDREAEFQGVMHEIHEAIDGEDCRLPDDWVYEKTWQIAETLEDRKDDIANRDEYDLTDIVGETADACVDIANSELAEWLKHGANQGLIDEAMVEYGYTAPADWGTCCIFDLIQKGQYLAIERIAYYLVEHML